MAVILVYIKSLSKFVNFCAAILILKMEDMQHLCFIVLKKVKMQRNAKKDLCTACRRCCVTEHVKSDLRSFLVLIFWPNNSLLWGCLVHWKMFSNTPGLYPLEDNSRRQPTYSKYPNQ